MKFMMKIADKVVGLFILLAILFLATALIFMGINKRWLSKDYIFHSQFKSGNGLSLNMPIKLKGFQIGKVTKIDLNEDNLVDIELKIFDTYYNRINYNCILELATSPIGIGGGMVFYPGRNKSPSLPEHSFIPSSDFKEAKALVAAGLVAKDPADDAITDITTKVQKILAGIPAIVTNLETTTDEVNGILGNINTNLGGNYVGPVGDILQSINSSVDSINASLESVAVLTAQLEDPVGLVPKVLDAQGTIPTLLNDNNELYNEIYAILNSLSGTLKEVETLSAYINETSPQLTGILEETRSTIDKTQDVLEGLKNNPLLRGGVEKEKEQPSTFESLRDDDF